MDWVDWYNTRRLLGSIGDIPPAEVEANHHAALEATPMANPGRFMAGAGAR
jgi:putative transposase